MKIYTKTGDKGSTSLFNGERVSKNALRVNCYGTIDELNSIIGIAVSFCNQQELCKDLSAISSTLFSLGSDLATPLCPEPKFKPARIDQAHIDNLEILIDNYTNSMPPLRSFILPGGSKCSAFLHNARTVCRRAERLIVELSSIEDLGQYVLIYVNRLSDYLFTASRYANFLSDIKDIEWKN